MIVEPVPTTPRSPVRRGLRLAAMLAPLALLVGVVAVGALGPQPVTPPPAPSLAAASVAASSPVGPVPDLALRPAVAFPERWLGMPVADVATALSARDAGGETGLVAVAGYLSYGGVPFTCMDAYLDPEGTDCTGRTTLTTEPVAVSGQLGSGFGGIGPHLHPQFPPGTRAPAPDDTPGSRRSLPIPVVLLGSFDDPRAVCGQRCDEAFVVSRVVWVAGDPWEVTLTVDPELKVDPNIPEIRTSIADATRRLGGSPVVLQTAVVRPDVLGEIDADAAAALPTIDPRKRLRPVTYVRGLFQDLDSSRPIDGRAPAIGWVVLDSVSGELLARGGSRPAETAAADPSPRAVTP